jgi:hypothetical protein
LNNLAPERVTSILSHPIKLTQPRLDRAPSRTGTRRQSSDRAPTPQIKSRRSGKRALIRFVHPRINGRGCPNRNVASQSNLPRRCKIQRSEDPVVHPPRLRRPQLPSDGGYYRRTGARAQASQTEINPIYTMKRTKRAR